MISNTISRVKGTVIDRPPPPNLPPISTMLQESGKVKITRLQMFWWTWIGITIYLFTFISVILVSSKQTFLANLNVPDVDYFFVILMGFSRVSYLAGKVLTPDIIRITEIRPNNAYPGSSNTILGTRFLWSSSKNLGKSTGMVGFVIMDNIQDSRESIVLTFWETKEDMDKFYQPGEETD
jgi:hypothetical protein